MQRAIRRSATVIVLVIAIATWVGSTAARAATPWTPQALCGPGYLTTDQDPIHDARTGVRLGTVHLLYNALTGHACAVTIKSAYVGTPTRTQVHLSAEHLPTQLDEGPRAYAAGPARAYVRGGCAIWGGYAADLSGTISYHDRANPAIGGIGTCF
ncbi:hypothetical protein [Micromonospora globbae]|uniref:hypothetical protein n=1 Tax=Micromonospora globbae TaxID=1894969 RepID=UPI00343D97A1